MTTAIIWMEDLTSLYWELPWFCLMPMFNYSDANSANLWPSISALFAAITNNRNFKLLCNTSRLKYFEINIISNPPLKNFAHLTKNSYMSIIFECIGGPPMDPKSLILKVILFLKSHCKTFISLLTGLAFPLLLEMLNLPLERNEWEKVFYIFHIPHPRISPPASVPISK